MDISLIRKIETALRQSESELSTIMENINIGIALFDKDRNLININRQLRQWFNVKSFKPSSPCTEISKKNTNSDICSRCPVLHVFETGNIKKDDFKVRLADKDRYLKITALPIFDSSGQVVNVLEILDDITEIKHAEDELKRQSQFLAILLDTIPSPVFYKDTEGRYLGCNRAFEKFIGRSKQDIIGKTAFDLTPEDLARIYKQNDDRLFDCGGSQHYESKVETSFSGIRDVIFNKAVYSVNDKASGLIGVITDITGRKQVEDKLRQFNDIVYRSPIVAVTWKNAEGWPVEFVSENIKRILGWSADEFMADDFCYSDIIHPDDLERVSDEVAQNMANKSSGTVKHEPYRIILKDGEVRWIDDMTVIKRDDEGNVIAFEGILIDITDRKQAEKELERNEKKYRMLVENLHEGIWRIDEHSITTYVNDAMAEMLGYEKSEMIGESLYSFMDETGRLKALEKVKNRKAGISEQHEFEFISKNGERIYTLLGTSPVIDDDSNFRGAMAVAMDITQRYKAEQALRESEEKLKVISGSALDAIVMIDSDGLINFWNKSAERIFGYTEKEALGKELHKFIVPEKYYEKFKKGFANFNSTGRGPAINRILEFTAIKKNSEEIPVEVSVSAIKLGEEWNAVGVIRDISERKIIERERDLLNDKLMHSQKMEAIGTLAGGIAHDFNNLLNVMMGFTELVTNDVNASEPMRYKLNEVLKAGKRASELVDRILTFSKRSVKSKDVIYIEPILRETVNFIKSSIPSNIEVTTEIKAAYKVVADPTGINQILMNLITNAYQALCKVESGGEITIKSGPLEINDPEMFGNYSLQPGKYTQIIVADNGRGMDKDILSRIFEPYFTTKTMERGTGLGLSTVLGIIEEYNGAIKVESALNKGSAFIFALPAYDSDNQQSLESGRKTILIIDDEKQITAYMDELLKLNNFDVVSFNDSNRALEYFTDNCESIDIVLTDYTMPGMTGKMLSEKILQIKPDAKIILLTGYSKNLINNKALSLGIKKYLRKPISGDDLVHTINQVIEME